MPKLLDKTNRTVTDSRSAIGFATTGGGAWEVWDRYLTVDGKHAYHVGNVCGTCAFFFERMEGANKGIEVGALASTLADGVTDLDAALVDTLAQLMPNSAYVVALLRVTPQRVQLLGSNHTTQRSPIIALRIGRRWPFYAMPPTRQRSTSSFQCFQSLGSTRTECNTMSVHLLPGAVQQRWRFQSSTSKVQLQSLTRTIRSTGVTSTGVSLTISWMVTIRSPLRRGQVKKLPC
jgi:hypothetical protein